MTTSVRPPARSTTPRRVTEDSLRKTALVVGVLFVITFITSIASKFALYPPVLNNADFIIGGGGDDTRVLWGALSELILIVANIGTAVALFPILKRQHEGLALGYVTARVFECVFIAVGILSILTIVTVRQDFSGAGDASNGALVTVGHALVALQEWTFLLGPGFVVGIGNGLILGYLMYRSGLVPRRMAMLGLIGGPLICLSGAAILLGVIEAGSVGQAIATIPEFFWELSLGIYLIVKGFKPSSVTAESDPTG
jgi:hypothetical protein